MSQFLSRRSFLAGAAAGLAVGVPAAVLGTHAYHAFWPRATPAAPEPKPSPELMPGRYPGTVVEVRDPRAVSDANIIDGEVVERMIDRGMAELTGTEPGDVRGTWGRFFERGDVVGIKVNPVGRGPRQGNGGSQPVGAISSPAVVMKVVACLRELGIPPQDILLFDRYADEMVEAGYVDLVRERGMEGVRWAGSSVRYDDRQVDIRGFDVSREAVSPELADHVAGYDPDVFTIMGYCSPAHDRRDDRRFRSHLSVIVTRQISKLINLPVLKDHRSAGVTLSLKNLSHGLNNNVARSHLSGIAHGVHSELDDLAGPNQCNTFIPQAASQHALRRKAALHILDGLIGVYEGGPGNWNRTWATWRHKGLFFATDPVALDHVGWEIIDSVRAAHGWLPVGKMGLASQTALTPWATAASPLATPDPLGAATLAQAAELMHQGRRSEVFNTRQPEHITLAGTLGLGVFDRGQIDHRVINS